MTDNSSPQKRRTAIVPARSVRGHNHTPSGSSYSVYLAEHHYDPGLLYVATRSQFTLNRDGAIKLATRLVEFAETMAPTNKPPVHKSPRTERKSA